MKFQISYPLNIIVVNQLFGANPQFYSDPKYGGIKGHNGIDFSAAHGTPVYATHDGMAFYEYDGAQGEGVVIRTNQTFDDGQGGQCYYKTIYWHFCDPIKETKFTSPIYTKVGYQPDQTGVSNIGCEVQNGDLIGYADNTGASTGDHLHFGLKPVAQGEAWGVWYNLQQNNGYFGAIDPTPFFDQSTPVQVQILTKEVGLLQQLWSALKLLLALKK